MTTDPWFVRRSVGIGWRPNSWQGWAITAVTIVAAVTAALVSRLAKAPAGFVVTVAVVATYALIAALTSRVTAPAPQHKDDVPKRDARVAPVSVAAAAASPPHPQALVVDRLTKRFGQRVAFQDVSFAVGAGEVFGFLGPNGAGKTTTVRTLGTLIAPTAGSATVLGIALAPRFGQEIRRRIAIMPESPGLYLRLSVRENLEFFAGLFSVANPQARISEALAAVNLAARADDLCSSLSKGLRQRVALARALLSGPEILFLDEPTSGLDPVATREVHDLIDGLRRRGVTVFLTTHRLEEAERLCDRVAILNTTLRMVGRPDELRAALFSRGLVVALGTPLAAADDVFASVDGISSWQIDARGRYVLTVSDPQQVAPALTRALVGAGADVESISESRHTLEDVYLELISSDVEAQAR